jgi:hypothetical protein
MELPATTVCKILGIPRWKYQDWEEARFLVRSDERCSEADAIEAAVVHLLTGQLDDEDVLAIMESIRAELRDQVVPRISQVHRLRIVCHLRGGTGELIYGDDNAGVGQAVSDGGTSMVIELGSAVSRVSRDFRHRAGLPKPNKKK